MTVQLEQFIATWQNQEGGQERANYGLFLIQLCGILGLPAPEPAKATAEHNDYVFERILPEIARDGSVSNKRIDLYKRNCFLLEAKQSRLRGEKQLPEQPALALPGAAPARIGRRAVIASWDVLMMNARRQAEDYVRLLPAGHEPPPFVLICDVGHCIEVYANFRRDGKAYDQFPDRKSFRIYLEDLRDEKIRDRLRAIWVDPLSLDPARHAARVTRDIAARIALVSKSLEDAKHPADDVAMFMMRVLFTMFAEDVDLLPRDCFKELLRDCEDNPASFCGMLEDLWRAMDEGGFTAAIRQKVPQFNGQFFKERRALPLPREQIGELRRAAEHDWHDVEPAIFGTLLEQALDKKERRSLGAHYTPRAYVERLVIATIIDPLRDEWAQVLSTAERQKTEGRGKDAIKTVQAFHEKLCETRVLDPACGTGNFLYVSLELMKRLEGEVLEAFGSLGGQEALTNLSSHTVDPHQFIGLELNPRAAAIAELVLWIGHLQWYMRTRVGRPSEPILRAFKNIKQTDAVLNWNGYPLPLVVNGVETYPNPRLRDWPAAEFIVGNPPFIGGKDLRARLGGAYAEALWAAHDDMNDSADFVMYWWERAAEILTKKASVLRRFGFVTTNSITQVFQRRVIERYLSAKRPLSLVMAIPDHPWTKATKDSAAVRIAMTVAEAGVREGMLREVTAESGIDTDAPLVSFIDRAGRINPDLTVGVDVSSAQALRANEGLSSRGVVLHGAGFLVTLEAAEALGRNRRVDLERHIRPYRNGRDLTRRSRDVMVIDLFGLTDDDVRRKFPEVYQHLLRTVKPERDQNNREARRANWWLYGENSLTMRSAISGLPRYIATVETAKHRVFQFLDISILPDNMIVAIGVNDPALLGILSSRMHVTWALKAGGWLGIGNDPRYSKSRCFDPFPFPAFSNEQSVVIAAIAEELDAHRKRVLADYPHLTLTGLYNVLERLRAGAAVDELDAAERKTFDDGLVLIMRELHDKLDAAVAAAYGCPADLSDEEILSRLVALNQQRAREEKAGLVRWLRPAYQIPRFGAATDQTRQAEADLGGAVAKSDGPMPAFPKSDREQTAMVMDALVRNAGPLDAAGVAAGFKPAAKTRAAITDVLQSLFRMGIVSSADGGKSFALRRSA